MKVWLMYDREGAARNKDYIDYHFELGRELGIDFDLYIIDDLNEGKLVDFIGCEHPYVAVVRTICPELNYILESNAVPSVNDYNLSRIANHKGRCIEYVRSHTDVPCVPTRTFHLEKDGSIALPGKEASIETLTTEGDVIKPVSGHGGNGVIRVPAGFHDQDRIREWLAKVLKPSPELKADMDSSKRTFRDIMNGQFVNEYVCQPFIEGPREDVRVYVIGKRIVAAVKRSAPEGEFRANASLGGMVSRYELKEKDREYVEKIIDKLHDGLIGVDFIIDSDGQFVFSEIEDVVGARMLYRTHPEIDILREYLEWIGETY